MIVVFTRVSKILSCVHFSTGLDKNLQLENMQHSTAED